MSTKPTTTMPEASPATEQGEPESARATWRKGKARGESVVSGQGDGSARHNVGQVSQKGGKKKQPPNVKSGKKASQPIVKRPRGRQSTYNQRDADEIVARLSAGEPLREICRSEHMPSWATVYNWMHANEEFAQRIARSREIGEEAIAQECFSIADDASNDWMEKYDKDGKNIGWQINHDHVQRSKLRIETRLKLLAKWNPKKWGEKVDHNHGGQPDNPIKALLEQVAGTHITPKPDADKGDT